MIFCPGVVFGVGEQAVGLLLELSGGPLFLDLLHITGGIALTGAPLVIRDRSSRTTPVSAG
ncbi:hypothetical protein ACFZCL_09610 [Streptomyces sp. NPDC008159]|uniref:hypothetical protein n=1 Tax=Streptomyces sp. NPDC008159 TaxID=3364817 RepID=UPI0036F1486D